MEVCAHPVDHDLGVRCRNTVGFAVLPDVVEQDIVIRCSNIVTCLFHMECPALRRDGSGVSDDEAHAAVFGFSGETRATGAGRSWIRGW